MTHTITDPKLLEMFATSRAIDFTDAQGNYLGSFIKEAHNFRDPIYDRIPGMTREELEAARKEPVEDFDSVAFLRELESRQ